MTFYCWNYEDNPEGDSFPYTRKDEMPWCEDQCVLCKSIEKRKTQDAQNTDRTTGNS